MPAVSALPAPFRWEGDHVAVDLGDHHVRFTTRRGGSSEAPYDSLNLGLATLDEPDAVDSNLATLAGVIGLPRARFALGVQVHGNEVQRRDEEPQPGEELLACDGQATHVEDVACLVLTADCLPVALLCDGAVGMVHAGWRGLAAGVLDDGLRALRELGGRGPVTAVIGPGAGGEHYEVGPEVFARLGLRREEKGLIDLKAIAAARLRDAGVQAVHDVGLCTMSSTDDDGRPLFFSHRRDGAATGRQAGVAWSS